MALSATGAGCTAPPIRETGSDLLAEVTQTEVLFAKSLPARDFESFMSFWSDDAVYTNRGVAVVGKPAIGNAYRRFFSGPVAPFSWSHDEIHLHERLKLAQSHGRIRLPDATIVGRYTTTWARQGDGVWRIVFDDVFNFDQARAT